MRCLSLTQPWASLVAIGAKRIETRSWFTSYRGPLAVHAAKGYPVAAQAFFHDTIARDLLRAQAIHQPPRGAVIAVCRLAACVRIHADANGFGVLPPPEGAPYRLTEQERLFGDYSPGRYAWLLADVEALPEPIPARGSLGLWRWTPPAGFPYATERTCRVCGCTDERACAVGCYWVEADLCSACRQPALAGVRG